MEGAVSQGMCAASTAGKGQEPDSHQSLKQQCRLLSFGNSDLQNGERVDLLHSGPPPVPRCSHCRWKLTVGEAGWLSDLGPRRHARSHHRNVLKLPAFIHSSSKCPVNSFYVPGSLPRLGGGP